jgi:glycerophosphoryl diester phosphodiesterase
MKIIAHRGASGYAPENTIAALKKALQYNIDMIEFDVHALPSGETILMHDHRINRTTDGTGYVLQHTFADLRHLDAGEKEIVPTLNEALDLINRQVRVNIELKGPQSTQAVANIIQKYLDQDWEPEDFLVSSFNHHELQEFKSLMPNIDIAALLDAIPLTYAAYGQELGATAVCPSDEFINEAYVDDAHKRGLRVYVWTINEPEEIDRMRDLGVDGIFTNFPDIARQVVTSFQTNAYIASRLS